MERRDVLQLLLVGLGIVVDAVVGLRWFAPPVVITPPTRAYHLVAEPGRYAATFAAAGLATVKGEGEAVVRAPVTV